MHVNNLESESKELATFVSTAKFEAARTSTTLDAFKTVLILIVVTFYLIGFHRTVTPELVLNSMIIV